MSKLRAFVLAGGLLAGGNVAAQSINGDCNQVEINGNCTPIRNTNTNTNNNNANASANATGGQGGQGGQGGEAFANGGNATANGGNATANGGAVNGSGNSTNEIGVSNDNRSSVTGSGNSTVSNTVGGNNSYYSNRVEAAANVAQAASTFALKQCVGHRSFAFSVVAGGFGWNSTPSGALQIIGKNADGVEVSYTVPEFVALSPADRATITGGMKPKDAALASCLTSQFAEQSALLAQQAAAAANVAQINVDGQIIVTQLQGQSAADVARIQAAGANLQVTLDAACAQKGAACANAGSQLLEVITNKPNTLANDFTADANAAAKAARERAAARRAAAEAEKATCVPKDAVPAVTCPAEPAPAQ